MKFINFQKKIHKTMKNRAESYAGEPSKLLIKYKNDLSSMAQRPFEESSIDEVFRSIAQASLIYLGDFHTFDQNTKNFERILKILLIENKHFIIGIEFIHFNNQNKIDDYLNNLLTELELLEEINYRESWKFPWNHYKFIFELAKKNGLKIMALNSEGNLHERDQFAANIVVNSLLKDPREKHLILFGEYHITPDKLPLCVSTQYLQKAKKSVTPSISPSQTIIHQNLDEVYWKGQQQQQQQNDEKSHQSNGQGLKIKKDQAKYNTEIVDGSHIVKFNNFEFSIQTSPPWVKYESQIYWYEHLLEDPDFDIHEYIMETGFKVFHGGIQENFLYILQEIVKILGPLDFSQSEYEDFNLLDHTSFNFIFDLVDQYKLKGVKTFVKKLLTEGGPFKLPFQNYYYCSSYSINRLSFLAGIKIQKMTLEKKSISEIDFFKEEKTKLFFYFLQQNLMAYFVSKIINPFRKCDLYIDLEEKLKTNTTISEKKKITKKMISLLNKNAFNQQLIEELEFYEIYSLAKQIGYLMGDSLYENFFKKSFTNFREILKKIINFNFKIDSYLELKLILLDQKKFRECKKSFF